MKIFIVVALCISFYACGCQDMKNSPSAIAYRNAHKFTEGELVCHKAGGPKGTIKKIYNDGSISVRFYQPDQPNNGITIGVGGNGVISGGKGITYSDNGNLFPTYFFMWHELSHSEMCP